MVEQQRVRFAGGAVGPYRFVNLLLPVPPWPARQLGALKSVDSDSSNNGRPLRRPVLTGTGK